MTVLYAAASSIFSMKIPYPVVGSLTRTWVTAPTSFPSWMMGERVAAVDKIEDKRKPEDFIGHHNRSAAHECVNIGPTHFLIFPVSYARLVLVRAFFRVFTLTVPRLSTPSSRAIDFYISDIYNIMKDITKTEENDGFLCSRFWRSR